MLDMINDMKTSVSRYQENTTTPIPTPIKKLPTRCPVMYLDMNRLAIPIFIYLSEVKNNPGIHHNRTRDQ
jgi:hypothetical protein